MPHPTRTIVLVLPPLLAVLPPETRGESMAGCALLIGLLALLAWRADPVRAPSQLLLLAAVLCAATLATLAVVPAAAVEPVAVGVLATAGALAVAWSRDGERTLRGALVALALAAVFVALHALYQKLWGLERLADLVRADASVVDRELVLARLGRGRAFASFSTPAALGGFLALSLPVIVGLAFSARSRRRALWIAVALLGGAAFLAAASATAALALLAAVVLAALLWSGARRTMLVGALVLVVALAGVAALRGARLLDLHDPEGPWRLRAGNFRAAASMIEQHPWTGVGPGGYAELYAIHRGPGDNETRHAHNLPLELAAEWGVPLGTALAALFFVLLLQPLWRERRGGPAWRRGAAIGLAAFALQNLADFTALMPSLLWSAALLRGAMVRDPMASDRSGPPGGPRVVAGASLAVVLLATAVTCAGGLAANARVGARSAGFVREPAETLRLARRAARLAPWDVDGALLLARARADAAQGNPADEAALRLALDQADHAVRLAPVRASARRLRARLRGAAGDLPGAFADLAEAARLHPVEPQHAAERDRVRDRLMAVFPEAGP